MNLKTSEHSAHDPLYLVTIPHIKIIVDSIAIENLDVVMVTRKHSYLLT